MQIFRKEICDGIVARDTVGVFEDIVAFIFKDQELDILAFFPEAGHQVFGLPGDYAPVVATLITSIGQASSFR